MNCNIRHIILSLVTAVAIAAGSCTSDPFTEPWSEESPQEIKLELAPRSRTVITTDSNIIEQPYMLFGDIKFNNVIDTIFHWHPVKFINNKWDYGTPQYWYMGHEHSFVAIHPFIPKGDPQVTILTYQNDTLSFTYTLPEKLEEAKDLLFATHRRKYTLDNTGPVQFKFTHLLPRINISMALIEKELMYDRVDEDTTSNRNEYIAVHSIEFKNIKTKASFKFTPKALTSGNSTSDYDMNFFVRDDQRVETVTVTLKEPCHVPNSYKAGVDDEKQELKYITALKGNEIILMLPQTFEDNPTAQMVVNYSINDDKDLMRRIVIPLAGTEWKEGVFYTYKFLIDNAYFGHIVEDGVITVDIDDFRLHGDEEEGDDSWITDDEDEDHNIGYTYDDEGNCGPDNPK